MNRVRTLRTLTLLGTAALGGCDARSTLPAPVAGDARASEAAAPGGPAPFRNWLQNFNHGTDGWITESTAGGPGGWCGGIERVVRGTEGIASSAGHAHAVVRQGACNDYWAAAGFSASGPYSPGPGYPLDFPAGGYTRELDIWLDPAWPDGAGFRYLVSFTDLAAPADDALHGLRYLGVPVAVDGGVLRVGAVPVEAAGWYRFRYEFADDGTGRLSVRFELVRRGRLLVSEALTRTHYTGEDVASFHPSGVGTGYDWFEWIAPGLDLPIDEHRVRQGGARLDGPR